MLTAPQLNSYPCFHSPSSCSLPPQFDMQRVTLEELKHILYHAFRDHLTMKDIENIIINEEESLNETSGNCQTEFEGGGCTWVSSWAPPCVFRTRSSLVP